MLQAHKIPDDLAAATMRSTADLRPGDMVAAVGFPWYWPLSVGRGGVGAQTRVRVARRQTPLEQPDPVRRGSQPRQLGCPLVTMDGEVVGIVTAILNPTRARTFIGIGFAVPIENAASAAGMPPF